MSHFLGQPVPDFDVLANLEIIEWFEEPNNSHTKEILKETATEMLIDQTFFSMMK